MKNEIKISAKYSSSHNRYVACIQIGKNHFVLSTKNGEELPKEVKKLTDIEIDYNFNECAFNIPVENRINFGF